MPRRTKLRCCPITFPGSRWCDDGALSAALSTTTSARRNVISAVRDTYNRLAIRDRFEDVLNPEQAQQFHIIKSKADWEYYKDRFVQEVEEFKILSFDTENKLTSAGTGPTVYVIVATPTGYTLCFDLQELAGNTPVDPTFSLEHIPATVRRFIRTPDYIKIGSDIARDLRATGICFRTTVDTRDIYRHYRRRTAKYPVPIIQIDGAGAREGLGIVNAWSKGEDTKPQTQDEYKERYGSHNYTVNGRTHWPWWRRMQQLYSWRKSGQGHLDVHHHWYIYHDGTAPYSLIYRVILERFIRYSTEMPNHNRRPPQKTRSFPHRHPDDELEADALPKLTRDFLTQFIDTITIQEDDVDITPDTGDLEITPAPQPGPTPAGWSDEGWSDNDLDEPPKKKHQRGGGRPYPTTRWRTADHSSIFWDTDPTLGAGCSCCGSKNHRYRADASHEIICPVFLNNKRGVHICTYLYCTDRLTHTVRQCKTLHHVCKLCYVRGHTEVAGCQGWSVLKWEDNKKEWERAADDGFYTSLRRTNWLFGYYAHRPFSPWPFPFISYAEIAALPVSYVRQALQDFAKTGAWPTRTSRKRPPNHSECRIFHSRPATRHFL